MKKLLLFVLTLATAVIPSFSQDLPYAREIINTLSSPEFKGRGYVDNGDRIAADYIAVEFQKLGLNSIANSKTQAVKKGSDYFQQFNVSVNALPGELMIKLNNNLLIPGTDYLIEAGTPGISGNFPVKTITRKDISVGDNALRLLDIKTKTFILVDNRDKSGETKEHSSRTDEFIELLKHCPNKNIKGILVLTNDKLSWEPSSIENPRPVVTINKDLDVNSVTRIEIIVESTFFKKYPTQNICGVIPGATNSDLYILVTAHYDHLGMMGKATLFPGANDNASGVALMLNLAKYYSVNKPKYTMVFVALGAEELGLFGAIEFVDNPPLDLRKINFLINLDLAGTGDEGIKVVNGSIFKDKFDLLSKINTENKLLPKVEIRGEACISDHCMFYRKGVPSFYIYTLGGINAYHDVYDRPETLPLTEFEDYCRLLIKFIDEI